MSIKSFEHKGLRQFFETGSTAGIQAQHAPRLGRMLRALGHEVTRAFTPNDVRGLIQQGQRWEVVLCDMVLEGANGFDVHELIAPIEPAPVFFFISGNVPPALADRLPELPHVRLLQKPIELDALQAVLDEATAEDPAA